MISVSAKIEEGLKEELQKIAEKEDLSLSQVIRKALKIYVNSHIN